MTRDDNAGLIEEALVWKGCVCVLSQACPAAMFVCPFPRGDGREIRKRTERRGHKRQKNGKEEMLV